MSQWRAGSAFPETRWSKVLRVRSGQTDREAGAKALAELCEIYWFPLYAFARRCGHPPHDAEDLTQGFFGRLLERELLAKADPARGRLRSFLLGVFKRFISEVERESRAQRRGGGHTFVSFDVEEAEERYGHEIVDAATPESLFERSWFDRLLQYTLDRLEQEYDQRGKGDLFRRLQDSLAWNSAETRVSDLARQLGMSSGAVRVAIFRMRQRFSELLEEHVADTTVSESETQEELEHLRRVMSG
ncbi:MAG: sigma-70 family RNA polymerase sigma factor [Verrucomicrobiales bacterium]|nr:sigma-70 family RNA polymerase sigma factor [Verrucomicrobiales bacterium]